MKPSAKAVLSLVARPDGACLWDFEKAHIGRFGARIHELRQLGHNVTRVGGCTVHRHRHHVPRYRLTV